MNQIFYITSDLERALGVENLLFNYNIIYSKPSQLAVPATDAGAYLKNFTSDSYYSSTKLLENPEVINYIKTSSQGNKPTIIVYKSDSKIEQICENNGFNLLNPRKQIHKEVENKSKFADFVKDTDIFVHPEHENFTKLNDLAYENLINKFGYEFYVQFIFGESGNGTFLIRTKEEFENLQKSYPLRQGKVTIRIPGPAYTVNCCVTRVGVFIGGISEQITGDPLFSSSRGGTIGNDFTQRHLDDASRSKLVEKCMEIGEILKEHGYKGVFGLDFILNLDEQKFYLIEANLRQVQSLSFISYLQQMNKQTPTLLIHYLELMNHDFSQRYNLVDNEMEEIIYKDVLNFKNSKDQISLNIKNNQPLNASQVIMRNSKNINIKVLDQFPSGVFRMRGRNPDQSAELEHEQQKYMEIYALREDGFSHLCLINRGYNIMEAAKESGMVIHFVPEMTFAQPHIELGRIQFLDTAFASHDSDELKGWIYDTFNAIKENSRIIEVRDYNKYSAQS